MTRARLVSIGPFAAPASDVLQLPIAVAFLFL